MSLLFRSCLAILVTLGSGGLAAADPGAAIDKKFENCIAHSNDTDAWTCIDQHYKDWDKLLNETYQKLMATLDHDQQEALRKAQRAWIAYRDADKAFRDDAGPSQGAVLLQMWGDSGTDVVQARTWQLQSYLNLTTDQN